MDEYDEYAARWAQGMRLSKPFADARRRAQAEVAKRNRALPRPCGIEDCKYKAHKGQLCRKHYAMVPQRDKSALMVACLQAQFDTSREFHNRFLSDLRLKLAA